MKAKTLLTSVCILALAVLSPALAHGDDDDERRDRRDRHHNKAANFQPLSVNHIHYGVSQFLYGHMSDQPVPVKLTNPNRVRQAAAMLIYTRGKSDEDIPTILEAYVGCAVRVLGPHGALGIANGALPDVPTELSKSSLRRYVEVLWAPIDPVRARSKRRRTRLADGLGGSASGGLFVSDQFALTHPSRFTLPSNDVIAGQREAAIDCVCQGLAENNAPPDTFSDFGVRECAK